MKLATDSHKLYYYSYNHHACLHVKVNSFTRVNTQETNASLTAT